MVMRKHQRYFPVYDAGGELLPAFVTVANGPIDEATVRVRKLPVLSKLGSQYLLSGNTTDKHHHPSLSSTPQACPRIARHLAANKPA